MSNIDINKLDLMISNDGNLQELEEQEMQKIQGGKGESKTIGIPYGDFPSGDGGCPACLSGYDPRYGELA